LSLDPRDVEDGLTGLQAPCLLGVEIRESREPGGIRINRRKNLIHELDDIANRPMFTCDKISAALEWLGELRQVAFHLLAAVEENPMTLPFRKSEARKGDQPAT
jgi:hypothetical protein